MDVQDGFILGIFNYCDRWCETCAFTSRCRLFADCAEMEATQDPTLKAVADAPPLHQDIPPPPPNWMQELIDEIYGVPACKPVSEERLELSRPGIAPDHQPIEARARAYSDSAHAWLGAHDCLSRAVGQIRGR